MSAAAAIVVLGAGGHAKVAIEVLRAAGRHQPVACVAHAPACAELLGVPVLDGDAHLPRLFAEGIAWAFVAIGDNRLRWKLGEAAAGHGFQLAQALDPRAVISPSARLGDGVLVMPGAVVNADAELGALAIVNTGAVVEHDCRVGEAAHLGPNAVLAGAVTLGAGALVGAGASVRPGARIGPGAVVGAGAVVTRDIPADAVYAGNPARALHGGP